jgi:hypothetical protein
VHKVLRKLNKRALYVKKSKASLKQRKLIPWLLFNLSKLRRTQRRQTQSGTGLPKKVKKVQAF